MCNYILNHIFQVFLNCLWSVICKTLPSSNGSRVNYYLYMELPVSSIFLPHLEIWSLLFFDFEFLLLWTFCLWTIRTWSIYGCYPYFVFSLSFSTPDLFLSDKTFEYPCLWILCWSFWKCPYFNVCRQNLRDYLCFYLNMYYSKSLHQKNNLILKK